MFSLALTLVLAQTHAIGFIVLGDGGWLTTQAPWQLRSAPQPDAHVVGQVTFGEQLRFEGGDGAVPVELSGLGWFPVVARHGTWRRLQVPGTRVQGWLELTSGEVQSEHELLGLWLEQEGLRMQVVRLAKEGVWLREGDPCLESTLPAAKTRFVHWHAIGREEGWVPADYDCC